MRRMIGRRPLGIWIALFAMLFCLFVAGGGQILSLVDWDLALRLQLQENDPNSSEIVQRVLAQVEWGVCVADVFLVLPLFAVGVIGVILRRRWGMIAGMMGAICWVYMFVAYTAQRCALVFRGGMGQWSDYAGIIGAFALLCLVPCSLIIWGLGANADRFAVPAPPQSHAAPQTGRAGAFLPGGTPHLYRPGAPHHSRGMDRQASELEHAARGAGTPHDRGQAGGGRDCCPPRHHHQPSAGKGLALDRPVRQRGRLLLLGLSGQPRPSACRLPARYSRTQGR